MKVILSEAALSSHFFERIDERIPKSVVQNYTLSKELDSNIRVVEQTIYPSEKFIVNLLKLNKYYVCGIVNHNQMATLYLRRDVKQDNHFSVYNVVKFADELKFIRSDKMDLGEWIYRYEDETEPFFFVVKNRIVIKVIRVDQLDNYKNFKFYSVD